MTTPYRLVSLADMMKLPITKLLGAYTHIVDFARMSGDVLMNHPGKGIDFDLVAIVELRAMVSEFSRASAELGCQAADGAAQEFLRRIGALPVHDDKVTIPPQQVELFSNSAKAVMSCLYYESATKVAITVLPERTKYFEPKNPLFGPAVHDRFGEASDDIEDAGRCLAFGQGTATVMHLMRVTEVGLKALAASLGIPYAPSWESYLKQIQKQIDAPHAVKTKKWKKSERFFRDVSGDLMTIKQAWRNPTMHVDRKYYPDEAEVIFGATRTLMQTLAKGLPAKKKAGK